ncbi:MAG: hypothetical protein L3J94_06865 [Gammaproteobacteria bacterium]|nr:hypothetical protein [Gammaproteobacteria bacterium]
MNRRTHTHFKPLWMAYLTILALLFVQNLPLHSHLTHSQQHDSAALEEPAEGGVSIHIMPSDTNDLLYGPDSEFELSSDGAVKNLKLNDSLFVMLLFGIILFVTLLSRGQEYSSCFTAPYSSQKARFTPPPRAPPC